MIPVLLAGRDWKTRALLRAQLIEEGVEVRAFESAAEAIEAAQKETGPAPLLIADLTESADPTAEIRQLGSWSARLPIWIIARRSGSGAPDLEGRGFEAVLFRPIDVGELVEQIKRRVKGQSGLGPGV
ncbi:MAG TPA: hypothetical protein VKU44_06510 [Terriglobia bacterium]|nr:hypothetical protein [Terriglobia bacterium]